MRLSQTIGLAWPRPGSGVCQRRFSPEATFHVTGAASADTPLAWGPRNCGQFVAVAPSNPAHVSKRTTQTGDSRWSRLGFMGERSLRLRETVLHSSVMRRGSFEQLACADRIDPFQAP